MAVASLHSLGATLVCAMSMREWKPTDVIDHVDAIAADRSRIDRCGELGSAAHLGAKPDYLAELPAELTTDSWLLTGRRAVPRPN